ncbi:hypothetical protein A2U01_0042661, partial [Trifolium medium]|nr:hypothetical protein [Trifolium medium]
IGAPASTNLPPMDCLFNDGT